MNVNSGREGPPWDRIAGVMRGHGESSLEEAGRRLQNSSLGRKGLHLSLASETKDILFCLLCLFSSGGEKIELWFKN